MIRNNHDIDKARKALIKHRESFSPMKIVKLARLSITSETLARALRRHSKIESSRIIKSYYTTEKGKRIAIYGAI
jgi:hypothetical protein